MDLATATGQDYDTVEIGGRTLRIGPLTAGQWGHLQAWIKANVKPPLIRAVEQLNEMDALGVRIKASDRQAILDGARKDGHDWPPRPGTPVWAECLQQEGAGEALFASTLGPFNPDLTTEDFQVLSTVVTARQLERLVTTALGARTDGDPKARLNSGGSSLNGTGG